MGDGEEWAGRTQRCKQYYADKRQIYAQTRLESNA